MKERDPVVAFQVVPVEKGLSSARGRQDVYILTKSGSLLVATRTDSDDGDAPRFRTLRP